MTNSSNLTRLGQLRKQPRVKFVWRIVLARLNAENVPYVITLDDVDETPALIVGTWTEPDCGAP